MKLYYAPGTCSLSPHIVLREAGLPFDLVRVDNSTKRTADGRDFLAINPKGYVAALELDNGEVLSEGPAIIQYLADLAPRAALAPPPGSFERVRLQEWLNFIAAEIHAGCSSLFSSAIPEEIKAIFKEKLYRRFDFVAATLESRDYLMGERYSVADAYLFTVMRWSKRFDIDLSRWPSIARFMERIGSRPAVVAALEAEARN
jgi:glutathione S-transferase